MKEKVLIIKLGNSETLDPEISLETSLGDVLRTTVILHLFKDKHVTWLVEEDAYTLLEGNPYIDRILIFNLQSTLQLQRERFDTVVNYEKVPGICALADSINAWRRFGFRFDEKEGKAQPYDRAEDVYLICRDKDIKRRHKNYWQEILFQMVNAKWAGEEYVLAKKPNTAPIYDIGLNWLVGEKWPNKAWPEDQWKELEKLIKGKYTYSWQEGVKDLNEYINWINSCRVIVTTDSLGLHIAIALKKRVIILYGPTHSGETFLYGLGKEIFPDVNYDCIPCLNPVCAKDKSCMTFFSVDKIKLEIDNLLKQENGEK